MTVLMPQKTLPKKNSSTDSNIVSDIASEHQNLVLTDRHHYGSKKLKCKHCKIEFHPSAVTTTLFCCRGCLGAWNIVQNLGLSSFYDMAADSIVRPAETLMQDYSIYDSQEFQASFVRSIENTGRDKGEDLIEAAVSIEGISCYACVWLIRQAVARKFGAQNALHTVGDEVEITVNQATGAAMISWTRKGPKLSAIIQFIEAVGYNVSPYRKPTGSTDQSLLIKVGVGLFVMMNVSSFALAEYFVGRDGMDAGLESFFRWISFALTTLSLGWTGQEFFTNTWRSLKLRAPHIDAPILVGLLGSYAWSLVHTVTQNGPVYYDSISAIVALVITGRFVQQNVLRRNQIRMSALISPRDGWALVQRQDAKTVDWAPIRSCNLKKGDLVRVLPGEMFPLTLTCVSSCAEVSFEQLRGESDWKTILAGDEIPAGALNGTAPIEGRAAQNGSDSYTELLGRSIERAINEKGQYSQWSDVAARVQLLIVFVAATLIMVIVGSHNLEDAISRAVALLLVACPCTFAIGVPLTFGTAMSRALQDGILFKSQRSLEKLATIRHIIFDKTGTLTEGAMTIKSWVWEGHVDESQKMAILSALGIAGQYSSHHTAQAVSKFAMELAPVTPIIPSSIKESQGSGLHLTFDDPINNVSEIRVGKYAYLAASGTGNLQGSQDTSDTLIAVNGQLVASLNIDDMIRPQSSAVIQQLKDMGCAIEILSGDSSQRTKLVASELIVDEAMAHGNATPSGKLRFLIEASKTSSVAMVGNGLNDAPAMLQSATSQAVVSIAVAGSSTAAMNSSDICILKPDITLVAASLQYAITTRRRMKIVASIAFFYNAVGLALASMGLVTPVVAAILMPLSSLTITDVATSWAVVSPTKPRQINKPIFRNIFWRSKPWRHSTC